MNKNTDAVEAPVLGLAERIAYGLGDMSSSMFWKIISYYLPIFFSDIYGLSLSATALLIIVARIWDVVSDPLMGIIADRTETRMGKYRPYLLWMAFPFAVAGCLLFYTPQLGESGKLIYAYVTYILMTTAYSAINVPYGAMLGVLTINTHEKTILSCYRMFFAFIGSALAMFAWEPLCELFAGGNDILALQDGWQDAMFIISFTSFFLFILSFLFTREHVCPIRTAPVLTDIKSLLTNSPWWLLTCAAMCTNLFNVVRGTTIAYYFKYYAGENARIDLGITGFLVFAGLFLAIGEVCNIVGVLLTPHLAAKWGKKKVFTASSLSLIIFSVAFFFAPVSNIGFISMFVLQILISVATGINSPLVWSMYGDVSDYSLEKNGTSSTALIFSSGSMAQKLGGAIAGSFVLWFFDAFGLVPNATEQTDTAILGLKITMSFIPAAIATLMLIALLAYPLNRKRMAIVTRRIREKRLIE